MIVSSVKLQALKKKESFDFSNPFFQWDIEDCLIGCRAFGEKSYFRRKIRTLVTRGRAE